jgi:hypothetical protein
MQVVVYQVSLPRVGRGLTISGFDNIYVVHAVENIQPPYDSVLVHPINDTDDVSRLVIINGKWQVQYYNTPHTINFLPENGIPRQRRSDIKPIKFPSYYDEESINISPDIIKTIPSTKLEKYAALPEEEVEEVEEVEEIKTVSYPSTISLDRDQRFAPPVMKSPPRTSTFQPSFQTSPFQTSPIIRTSSFQPSPVLQTSPTLVQSSFQTSPILRTSSFQTSPILQTSPFQTSPTIVQTPSFQTSPILQTSPFQTSPTIVQTPSFQTSPILQTSPFQTSPTIVQTPSFQTSPTIVQTPSFQTSPTIVQTPSFQTSPILQTSPTIVQTPSFQTSPILQTSPTIVQTPSFQTSPTLVQSSYQPSQLLQSPSTSSFIQSPFQTPSPMSSPYARYNVTTSTPGNVVSAFPGSPGMSPIYKVQ